MAQAAVPATGTAGLPAELQRIDQRIKTLAEQLVDFRYHTDQLGAIKMALHQAHHVLHQQVALDLHDGGRVGPDEQHHKIVARLGLGVFFVVLVKLDIIESDFNRGPGVRQLVYVHSHFVEHLAKVVVASNRPAHLQQVVLRIEFDAWFIFVKAACGIGKRTRARVFPQGFECFLQMIIGHLVSKRHLTMNMNF